MAAQQDITYPARDGTALPAFLALPDGDGPHPGVVVVHEAFGLTDDIRRICRRFAEAGYAALAPDLLARGPKLVCVAKAFRDLRRGTGESFDDLEAAREHLAGHGDVDGSRLGAAGFCMGGGFALLLAARAPLGATAPFYGDVPKDRQALAGVPPVCASYGGRDRLFAGKAATLERHLTELGVPHEVKVYPSSGHSFMNLHPPGLIGTLGASGPMKAGYNHEDAEDAWRRVLAFFAEHLGR